MKQLLFLLLFPCLAVAQYTGNGNQKITLGEQTTADGLVFRGLAADTNVITPFSDTSAYIILDTVNNRFYNYKRNTNVWTQLNILPTDTSSMLGNYWRSGRFSGVLPVANGGTGEDMSSLPNNYLVRKNSSGIFDTANVYEANGNIGLNVIPSSWGSQFKAIESGDNNNQSSVAFNTNANGLNFFANAFFDGSNTKYKYSDFATRFVTGDGKYEYYSAPSGTAGNNITWTEVMTINASGNLGINQPAPTQKLHVVGNARITAMNGIGDIGADANGVLQAATSDMNLKNTIENTPFGLNEILLLNPVTFLYNDENRKIDSDVKEVGFIAQDVFDIIPNAVSSTGTGDLQLDYRAITATLDKAIQEQQAIIKALEQRILILENK